MSGFAMDHSKEGERGTQEGRNEERVRFTSNRTLNNFIFLARSFTSPQTTIFATTRKPAATTLLYEAGPQDGLCDMLPK